jgi:hypothetical protein
VVLWLSLVSPGAYIVILPPDYESNNSYPLVLTLHGSGSNEIEHGRIVEELGRAGVIYAAVRAFGALSVVAGTRKPAFTAWPADTGRSFEPARAGPNVSRGRSPDGSIYRSYI